MKSERILIFLNRFALLRYQILASTLENKLFKKWIEWKMLIWAIVCLLKTSLQIKFQTSKLDAEFWKCVIMKCHITSNLKQAAMYFSWIYKFCPEGHTILQPCVFYWELFNPSIPSFQSFMEPSLKNVISFLSGIWFLKQFH